MRTKFASAFALFFLTFMAGCVTPLPPEQQKNYALVVSEVNEFGGDAERDVVPCPPCAMKAHVAWIDGKVLGQAPGVTFSSDGTEFLPGAYKIQVGLRCGDTATCRPGPAYHLNLEAGKRYVLKPNNVVYVSDRFSNRSAEVPYK